MEVFRAANETIKSFEIAAHLVDSAVVKIYERIDDEACSFISDYTSSNAVFCSIRDKTFPISLSTSLHSNLITICENQPA